MQITCRVSGHGSIKFAKFCDFNSEPQSCRSTMWGQVKFKMSKWTAVLAMEVYTLIFRKELTCFTKHNRCKQFFYSM